MDALKAQAGECSKASLAALNTEHHDSLDAAFRAACRRYRDRVACHGIGHSLTYAELEEQSRAFAAWLLNETGLEYGDRVAIQLPNLSHYLVAAWGVLRAGLVVVNTNPMYTERELEQQLRNSGARLLVVLADLLPRVCPVVERLGVQQLVSCTATRAPADDVPASQEQSAVSFGIALQQGARRELPVYFGAMQDVAVLQYTGGTTGIPKGAMLTHGNLYAAARQSTRAFARPDRGDEIVIAPMPLYHVYGFGVNVVSGCLHGRTAVLVPDPRNLDDLVCRMRAHRFTGMAGVNSLFAGLLRHPEFDSIDFSRADAVVAGGAPLLPAVAGEWEERTGQAIHEGWGMTETSGAGAVNPCGSRRLGTVGRVTTGFEARVVDSAGTECARGEPGELQVRGDAVMRGYWQQPDATAAAFTSDGFLHTGDVAVMDEDGYLRIVDRIKDMINVSGFNVFPNEIEAVVQAHPDVLECAAIGVPDERSGEAVRLYVVGSNAAADATALRDWCRERLTNYKRPRDIEICKALPKSSVGKILRRALRDSAPTTGPSQRAGQS